MPVRRRRSPPLLLFVVSLLSAGCGEPSDAGPATVDAPPLLSAREVQRIGSADDPDLGFSRVSDVDVDRDGSIYVMEASVPEIRVFLPDGTLLRTIGRRGEGPGEFSSTPSFGVKGDTVWTIQTFAGRLTLFDRQGRVLQTGIADRVVVPLPDNLGYVTPRTLRRDGTFLGVFGMIGGNRGSDAPGVASRDSFPWPIVRFDPAGAVIDTLGSVAEPPPRMWRPPSDRDFSYEMIDIAGDRMFVPSPPPSIPIWFFVDDDRIVVSAPAPTSSDDATLTVTRIGLDRDTVYHRPLSYTPLPYTETDLDSIAVRAARGEPGGLAPYNPEQGPPPDWEVIANRLRAEMDFPAFQPPLDYPWPADDGGVWLRRAGNRGTGLAEWVVLDPDGRPRGRLELPDLVRPLWARGDTVWAARPDALDVPWLVRYQIEEGGGGGGA